MCAQKPLPALNFFEVEPGWRNGRRGGLKIRYLHGCVGSNPALGTSPQIEVVYFPLTNIIHIWDDSLAQMVLP